MVESARVMNLRINPGYDRDVRDRTAMVKLKDPKGSGTLIILTVANAPRCREPRGCYTVMIGDLIMKGDDGCLYSDHHSDVDEGYHVPDLGCCDVYCDFMMENPWYVLVL
ncbi:hypothetical protein F0562_000425 [Nyssa sinensis]|uniref:Uncharacterized protein n=1 Tax=Nyssa sinensis TaxID=561372 RepID=A0A5J5C564_9ASTE|nr:hypothetical protein F0562_000425 [Nyssa sinensis]